MFIPDPEIGFFPSRIADSGAKSTGSATLYLPVHATLSAKFVAPYSLTCLNLAAAASGLGYAVITTIPNTLITMYHEEPELYYGSHSARAGVGEDIAILDSGYFLSQVGFTDKKENLIFLIYWEIQSEAFAKSYMRKGFLIYEEMGKYFPIYEEAVSHI